MRLQVIDDQPFICEENGKREQLHTLAEFIATEQAALDSINLAPAEKAVSWAEREMNDAVLAGTPHDKASAALDKAAAALDALHRQADEHRARIKEATAMFDNFHARQQRQADTARAAAVLAPIDEVLKECRA